MGQVGNVYLNFGLWGIALIPAWYVVREIGVTGLDDRIFRRGGHIDGSQSPGSDDVDNVGKAALSDMVVQDCRKHHTNNEE